MNLKGLHEVIVSAGVGCLHFVLSIMTDADYHNRYINDFPNPAAGLQPTNSRQIEIQHDHIDCASGLNLVQSLLTGRRFDDDASRACQSHAQRMANQRVIAYKKNLRGDYVVSLWGLNGLAPSQVWYTDGTRKSSMIPKEGIKIFYVLCMRIIDVHQFMQSLYSMKCPK